MDFLASHQATFWQNDDWGSSPPQIFVHKLTPTDNDAPAITVAISFARRAIHLSYFIERTSWLHLPIASNANHRADYLWEQDCLECFFEFDGKTDYMELNFSPNSPANQFNLYRFTDYRTPNVMPPVQTDGHITTKPSQPNGTHHAYHLSVCLNHSGNISKIHPAAILYHHNKAIFYAVRHATPPDFHDKAFWQVL